MRLVNICFHIFTGVVFRMVFLGIISCGLVSKVVHFERPTFQPGLTWNDVKV